MRVAAFATAAPPSEFMAIGDGGVAALCVVGLLVALGALFFLMILVAEERHALLGGVLAVGLAVALAGYAFAGGGPMMWVGLGIAGLVIAAYAIKELMTLY